MAAEKKNLLKYITAAISAIFIISLSAWGIVHYNSLKYSATENADNYLGALASSKAAELNGFGEVIESRIERAPLTDDFYETKKVRRKTVRKFLGSEWLKAQVVHFEASAAALYNAEGKLTGAADPELFEKEITGAVTAASKKIFTFKEIGGKFFAEVIYKIKNYPKEESDAELIALRIPVDNTILKSLRNVPQYLGSEQIFVVMAGGSGELKIIDLKENSLRSIPASSGSAGSGFFMPANENELLKAASAEGKNIVARMKNAVNLDMKIVCRADAGGIEDFYKPEGKKIIIFISAVTLLLVMINYFLLRTVKKKKGNKNQPSSAPVAAEAEEKEVELDASLIQNEEELKSLALADNRNGEMTPPPSIEAPYSQRDLEKIFTSAADEMMPGAESLPPGGQTAAEEELSGSTANPDELIMAEAIVNESVHEETIVGSPETNDEFPALEEKKTLEEPDLLNYISKEESKKVMPVVPVPQEIIFENGASDGVNDFPAPGLAVEEKKEESLPMPAEDDMVEPVMLEVSGEEEQQEQELVEGKIDYLSGIGNPTEYEKPNKDITGRLDSIKGFGLIPKILFEINLLLKSDPDNNQKLASLIIKEHSLTTKLLRTANAPYYGLKKKVTSVEYAIILLGREEITRLITALSLSDAVRFPSTNQLRYLDYWHHTMSVGFTSRDIAERLGFKEISNEAFLGGIFHDLGIQILAKYFPNEFAKITEKVISGVNALEAEKSVTGSTHQEIGRYAAEKWGLPEMIYDAISFHHNPTASENAGVLTGIINMSDWMTHQITKRQSFWEGGLDLEASNFKELGFKNYSARNEFLENYYPFLHATIASIHF